MAKAKADDYRAAPAVTLTIFGASGDLTARKLVPALYDLFKDKLLPEKFALVGLARREWDDAAFRDEMQAAIAKYTPDEVDDSQWQAFADLLYFLPGSFEDSAAYERLRETLESVAAQQDTTAAERIHLFYLSTPPDFFPVIVEAMKVARLTKIGDTITNSRLIVEKPFGTDLESAKKLNKLVNKAFREEQVYRIDHYLGKETVQNILAFRMGNSIFEPLWNQKYIDHVQITVAEAIGIEGRGGYYEGAGALRDIIQNHALQLLALIAMEPPAVFEAEALRDEKVKVLHAIRPIPADKVEAVAVRGQYEGYLEEKGVAPDSRVETYAALELAIDNWRWAGVPFYIRTGKALAERVTEIMIQFRQPPLMLFAHSDEYHAHEGPAGVMEPSLLTLRIQPDEGISLRIGIKPPGGHMRLQPVTLDFLYKEEFPGEVPEAYERLLLDAMQGDPTLFIRRDEVEVAWKLLTPVLEAWEKGKAAAPERYAQKSEGPAGAEALLADEGRAWRPLKIAKSE